MGGLGADNGADRYHDLLAVARGLLDSGEGDRALRIYDEVSEELASARDPELMGLAAFALKRKAERLGWFSRFDEALSTTALLMSRYWDSPERDVRKYVAGALVDRAYMLLRRRKYRHALRALDDALARSFYSTESGLRAVAAVALACRVRVLSKLFRPWAAYKTAQTLLEYVGNDPDAEVLDAVLKVMNGKQRDRFLRHLSGFHELDVRAKAGEGG